ncbi:MAG: MlaD family protein [Solirubrobacteraceae bacterium]
MKRLVLLGGLLLLAVAIALGVRSGGDDRYRVDVVFDTARGMVPGQVMKIAGAKVGTLERVTLTRDRKARMEFRVDPKFAPFRDDASCKILPEGFISESFVQCEPGTPGAPHLGAEADGAPTVPVGRTSASVQLQQVIDTFPLPVDERIRILIHELGLASAGRGADLNAMLRRANPALRDSRRALAVINGQRAEIERAVGQTDRVLARLREREGDVRGFVARAATVADTTARHGRGLGASLKRLPSLMREIDGRLAAMDATTDRLLPTVRNLRAAAPGLRRLNATMPRFADATIPGLRGLGSAADRGRATIPSLTPVVRRLSSFVGSASGPVRQARDFLDSTISSGAVESVLMDTVYSFASMAAAKDQTSHVIGMALGVDQTCVLGVLGNVQQGSAGCAHQYSAPGVGKIPPGGTTSRLSEIPGASVDDAPRTALQSTVEGGTPSTGSATADRRKVQELRHLVQRLQR